MLGLLTSDSSLCSIEKGKRLMLQPLAGLESDEDRVMLLRCLRDTYEQKDNLISLGIRVWPSNL